MTIRKTLVVLLSAGMLLFQPVRAAAAVSGRQETTPTPAYLQQQVLMPEQYAFNAANPKPAVKAMAYGLLADCSCDITVGAGCVYLNSQTFAYSTMRKIGLKTITLQYSPNGATFTDVMTVSDFYNTNRASHYMTGKRFPSFGAGYYRFCVTHYAQNSSFDTQTKVSYSIHTVKLYY